MALGPGRGKRSVGGHGMRGGFPHTVRGMYSARRRIPHQEGKSQRDEADRGADVERLVHAQHKHVSHRVENEGKLIAHPWRDDRRDHFHTSLSHELDELLANCAVTNWQRVELRTGMNAQSRLEHRTEHGYAEQL